MIDHDLAAMLRQAAETPFDEASYMAKGKFKHNLFGDAIAERQSISKVNGKLHVFDGRKYRPDYEIINELMTAYNPEITDRQRKETAAYLKYSPRVVEREEAPAKYIPLKSEILNVETMERIPYSSEIVFLQTFAADYPTAPPDVPSVEKYRRTMADGDGEIMTLLDEFRGYCLYRQNMFRMAVLLYGAQGSNGKSTELELLRQFVGEKNASSLSLQDTAERFRIVDLYTKSLNAGDDIPAAALRDSSLFKKLVTGETIYAERKGEQPFPFKNTAKLIFAANELPLSSDKTQAYYSRLTIVPFTHDFARDPEADPEMKEHRWTQAELNAFCWYAVNAFRGVLARGGFTIPKKCDELMRRYQTENDPITAYIDEVGLKGIVDRPTQAVYDDFTKASGYRTGVTRKKFTRVVKDHFGGLITTKGSRDGGSGPVLQTFALTEEG